MNHPIRFRGFSHSVRNVLSSGVQVTLNTTHNRPSRSIILSLRRRRRQSDVERLRESSLSLNHPAWDVVRACVCVCRNGLGELFGQVRSRTVEMRSSSPTKINDDRQRERQLQSERGREERELRERDGDRLKRSRKQVLVISRERVSFARAVWWSSAEAAGVAGVPNMMVTLDRGGLPERKDTGGKY